MSLFKGEMRSVRLILFLICRKPSFFHSNISNTGPGINGCSVPAFQNSPPEIHDSFKNGDSLSETVAPEVSGGQFVYPLLWFYQCPRDQTGSCSLPILHEDNSASLDQG